MKKDQLIKGAFYQSTRTNNIYKFIEEIEVLNKIKYRFESVVIVNADFYKIGTRYCIGIKHLRPAIDYSFKENLKKVIDL